MIYSPSKFVFIHIPRTGGMSITQALAGRLPEIADMTINVSGLGDQRWWRHSRACELARDIPHWDKLYKFAVIRNPWEIVASFWRLVQRDLALLERPRPTFPRSADDYWEFLSQTSRMSFEEWVPWHFAYLRGSGGFWRYWCCGPNGEDLGVEPVRYERLREEWPGLCKRLGVGRLKLPRVNEAGGSVEWTPDAVESVRDLCSDDMARFGYCDAATLEAHRELCPPLPEAE